MSRFRYVFQYSLPGIPLSGSGCPINRHTLEIWLIGRRRACVSYREPDGSLCGFSGVDEKSFLYGVPHDSSLHLSNGESICLREVFRVPVESGVAWSGKLTSLPGFWFFGFCHQQDEEFVKRECENLSFQMFSIGQYLGSRGVVW